MSAASPRLICKLRKITLQRGPSPTAGEVELENISGGALQFEVRTTLFGYLNLVVVDADGAVISDFHYGDLFSPLAEPYVFSLKSGEKYTANVDLLGNVAKRHVRPGDYSVQAVFQYKDLKAVSEPLALHLPGSKGKSPAAVAAKN